MPLSDLILPKPSQSRVPEDPIQPVAAPPDAPKLFFTRGNTYPQAVAWFSVRSFWGHLCTLSPNKVAISQLTRLRCPASRLRISHAFRHSPGSLGDHRRSVASIFLEPRIHVCIGASKYERKLTQDASLSQGRRIFGNGSESCPRGALLRFGGPRADKPARAKPSRIASAVNAT